jgi:hypothetical protein
MINEMDLIKNLKELIKILYDEKEALLNSDGHKVAEIVEGKKQYIEKLASYKGIKIEENSKILNLVEEINSLQEINLLLTKQALSYQEVLLDSIARNVQALTHTYSNKGNYDSSNSINLIDQSV